MRTFGQCATFSRLVIGFSSLTINRGIMMWTYFHPTKSFLLSAGQYKGKGSVFSVLPFGLASAHFVFTKIQKALVKHWREQGIRIFTYLDDGTGVEKSYATASAASNIVKGDIAASGFIAHPEKCCREPTQVGDLLGFALNLKEGSIYPPPERIARLLERITHVSSGNPTARLAAGLVGTVVSMGLALGPVNRLWTRALYRHILSTEFWSQRITLSPEAVGKLSFGRTAFITAIADQFGTQIRK